MSFPQSVEPVFVKRRDLPPLDLSVLDGGGDHQYSALDICLAAERVSGKETIFGAQDIKGLWRIYPLTRDARNQLLISGITLNGHSVALQNKNPFILKENGHEMPATKLFISDIPISCSDKDIETALVRIGCILRSSLTLERIRDKDGKLTRFVTGRRFCFINVPPAPLDRSLKVGAFTARLYHKEQPKVPRKPVTCSRCLQPGHMVAQCQNLVTCRTCLQSGHKSGDAVCQSFMDTFPTPGLNVSSLLEDANAGENAPETEVPATCDKPKEPQDDAREEPPDEPEHSAQSLPPRQTAHTQQCSQISVNAASSLKGAEDSTFSGRLRDSSISFSKRPRRSQSSEDMIRERRNRLFESDSDHEG